MGEARHRLQGAKEQASSTAAHYGAAVQGAPGHREALVGYLAQQLAPYVGERVLHLNAGAGGLCQALLPRKTYVACAPGAEELGLLQARLSPHEGLAFAAVRAPFAEHLPQQAHGFDTILWTRDTPFSHLDQLALRHLRTALAPHGRILLLVTGAKEPFIAVDEVAEQAQLQLRQVRQFDRIGTPVVHAQRMLSWVGLGLPVQALGDVLRPLASKWDDRWPFAGRHALAVLVHAPLIAEASCTTDACQSVRLERKQPLS
jgi:hypothetical protein